MSADDRNRPLRDLGSPRNTPGRVFAVSLGMLLGTAAVYLLLCWADNFPILPGGAVLEPSLRLLLSVVVMLVLMGITAFSSHKQRLRMIDEAERMAERGEQIRAARMLKRATGLPLDECVRAIEARYPACPSAAPPDVPEEIRRLAEAGHQLQAVERLQEMSGISLEEAMRQVETLLGIRPWWQDLANDPSQKIAAIAAYREEHSVGLAEAKRAVEDYLAGRAAGADDSPAG